MDTFIPKGRVRGFIMPDFVFKDTELPLGAKVLYALLCQYAGDKDHCWPTHVTLAARLGCSVNTVKKLIRMLIQRKLIAVSVYKKARSNRYYLLNPRFFLQAQATSKGTAQSIGQGQKLTVSQGQNLAIKPSNSAYNLNLTEKSIYIPPSTAPSATQKSTALPSSSIQVKQGRGGDFSEQDFESFFAVYPKQENKGMARAVWKQMQNEGRLPSIQLLQEAVLAWKEKQQWQQEEGRYIPLAVNFLRKERWLEVQSHVEAQKVTDAAVTRNAKTVQQYMQQEAARRQTSRAYLDSLRPLFERVAASFAQPSSARAFGLWAFLHEKGCAPTLADVPEDAAHKDVFTWLQSYQRGEGR